MAEAARNRSTTALMRLSVVIPTLGRPSLWWVLQRLTEQPEWDETCEAIVIFDGKKIEEKQFSGVSYFQTQSQLGAATARNLGIQKATGSIIAFLGDDTAPCSNWIAKTLHFHEHNMDAKSALLGCVKWTSELEKNQFHRWLGRTKQFRFGDLTSHKTPDWRYFYTSNLSLKRSFLAQEKFSDAFSGWGFEDTELGYRLYKKGMKLVYEPTIIVEHDHPHTLASARKNAASARKNAFIFQSLHPEISLVPTGTKAMLKRFQLLLWNALSPLWKRAKWEAAWNKSWLDI